MTTQHSSFRRAGWSISIFVACGIACGGPTTEDAGVEMDAGTSAPVSAVFTPTEAGTMGWGDLPWPNDLHIGADGTLDVTGLPGTGRAWGPVHEALGRRRGFCVSCAVFFPVSGSLDGASVTDAAVVLVEMDAGVPVGEPIPVDVEHNPWEGVIVARPHRGIVLERERTYAAALLAPILTSEGEPLAASAELLAIRDGEGAPVARAVAVIGPAIDAVVATGVTRTDILAATAFTTWDYTEPVREITGVVDAWFETTAPAATFERAFTGAELDDLFGVPAANLPGLDNPSVSGADEDYGVTHSRLAMLVLGTVTGPRTVEGTTTDIGFPRTDAAGALVAGPDAEAIPWLLFVPDAADLSNLPIVLAVAGIGGRKEQIGVIDEYMGAGYALLIADPFGNGRRAASATDEVHAVRGPGGPRTPDGLSEHESTNVVARAFGLDGAAPGLTGCPLYNYGLATQLVTDVKTMLRLIRGGDWSSLQSAVPALAGLAFDPNRIGVLGASLGSGVATVAIADEPDLAAYTSFVAFGSYVDVLAESPVFRPLVESLWLDVALRVQNLGRYDEEALHLGLQPALDTLRFLLDGMEPQVLGRHLVSAAALHAGGRPDVLVQLGRLDETTGAPNADALCLAAGLPGFGGYTFADVVAATSPISGNLPDGRTAACYRFAGAGHGAGTAQRAERDNAPPILYGHRVLDSPVAYENPIADIAAQGIRFLDTATTGVAEIATP